MLNSASCESGSGRPAPRRAPSLSVAVRADRAFWDTEQSPGKLECFGRVSERSGGVGERWSGAGEQRRPGRTARPVSRLPRASPQPAWGPLRLCVFLPPPQQGTFLRLNLSAGLNIHHEPDRRAKFTSNAVNPLQAERLPQGGPAWRARALRFRRRRFSEAAAAAAPFSSLLLFSMNSSRKRLEQGKRICFLPSCIFSGHFRGRFLWFLFTLLSS